MRRELLDSTLREGELFKVFSREVKVRIAEKLAEAGLRRVELTVDYPPRTTYEDVKPVVDVLQDYGVLTVLHGRAHDQDIRAMARYGVEGCALYLSLTQLHREFKLHGISLDEAVRRLADAIAAARELGFKYVRATVEDASRLFVEEGWRGIQLIGETIGVLKRAGATIVSVPDTAGLLTPGKAAEFIKSVKKVSELPIAAHFHNDYGMASANTVEAALVGADELHVTVMGIGDRNGIADLYEVAATLEDVHGIETGIDRDKLGQLYRFFTRATGIKLSWRHPLSDEARRIRAGVHQSMTIKRPEGYMPAKKLQHDFGALLYEMSPYVSHKLVAAILGEGSVDEQRVRRLTEALAVAARQAGSRPSLEELREIIKHEAGVEVSIGQLERFFGSERVYILVKLDPRAPAREIVRELMGWDDIESVDEVYGDADMVITAQMSYRHDNVVNRIRQRFAEVIEDMKVLVTD